MRNFLKTEEFFPGNRSIDLRVRVLAAPDTKDIIGQYIRFCHIWKQEAAKMLTIPIIKKRITPICKRYGIERAYLFGSYSRNEATENSDVDLHIEPGKVKDLFTLSGVRLDIMDVLGIEVDLISKLPESEHFRKNLEQDEVLLYEA